MSVIFKAIAMPCALAVLCASAPLAAQVNEAGAEDRAFIRLVADAVRHQPDFGSQEASVGQAQGSLSEAKSDFFPRVQLLMDSGQDRTVRSGRTEDIPGSRHPGDVNPQLAFSQLLYDGGATWGRVRAAKGRVSAASRGVDAVANNLTLQAVQLYFTVLRQRDSVKIGRENLAKVQSVRDKVAGRALEGRDPRSELSRLDSRVLEARNQLTDAERDLDDANATYEEFFGAAPGELLEPSLYPNRRDQVEQALLYARAHNAELLSLRDELNASAADLDSQRATMLWPRLSLEASGTAYDAFGSSGVDNRDTYVGVRVSYDLFTGGASAGRTRQASGRHQAARLAVERAELALDRRLRQAYAAVETRETQTTTMADRVARDHSAIDDYEELFLAGRRTLNDLIVAQRDYFASAMQFLDVQLDLRVQRFSVAALTGELAPFFGIDPRAPATDLGDK
ncbi:MAG: TolC family protein [Gammaproteobacteria bacterium]